MSLTDDEYSDSGAKSRLLSNKKIIHNQQSVKQPCTDLPGIFLFLLSILSWLGTTLLVLYAFKESNYSSNYEKNHRHHQKYALFKHSDFYVLFALPSLVYLWLYFVFVRFFTKLTIIITIIGTITFWIMAFYAYIAGHIGIAQTQSTLLLIGILISIGVHTIIFYASLLEINYISKVLKNSCRTMMCTPSYIVISILQMSCMALVIYVSWAVINEVQDQKFGLSKTSQHVFITLHIVLSLWLLAVIYNFGQMILCKTFTTWCRTADKQSIPYGIALICAASHFRYHMGTSAFGSTILTVVPLLLSICHSWKSIVDNIRMNATTLVCLPFIIGSSTDNAFIMCVIYGKNFYNSMKNSFRIILQDPVKFTATRLVANWIILFGLIIPPALAVGAAVLIDHYFHLSYSQHFHHHFRPTDCYWVTGILSFSLVTIFLNSLHASISSILLCSMEALDCSESQTQIQRFNNDIEDPTPSNCIE